MTSKDGLSQIRRWTTKELSSKIAEGKKELFTLSQEKILGKLKNVAQIRHKKRLLARYATILDEKISSELETK